MIEMRRAQLSFGDGLIVEEVSDLREDWMKHADEVLADEDIVAAVYEALAKRHRKSRCRGRWGTPADVVLRLLILKHIRNWSYRVSFWVRMKRSATPLPSGSRPKEAKLRFPGIRWRAWFAAGRLGENP
jgi:hypothetical protein